MPNKATQTHLVPADQLFLQPEQLILAGLGVQLGGFQLLLGVGQSHLHHVKRRVLFDQISVLSLQTEALGSQIAWN